jgi:hypothetical protein
MRKLFIYFVPFLIILLVWGCRKSDSNNTPFGRMQGRWKLAKVGTDDNGNGTIEASEIKAVVAGQDMERVYKGDGTGVESNTFDGTKDPDLTFTWAIIGGDSLRMQYKANDTITYYMQNVTSGDMTLTQNTTRGLVLQYFVKH